MNTCSKTWQSFIRHELSNPINTIIGYSGLLLDDLADYEQEEDITWIVTETKQLKNYGYQLFAELRGILPQTEDSLDFTEAAILEIRYALDLAMSTLVEQIRQRSIQLESTVPGEFAPDFQKIAKAAQRLLSMIDNLLVLVQDELLGVII